MVPIIKSQAWEVPWEAVPLAPQSTKELGMEISYDFIQKPILVFNNP